jgi:hypothetical protein
MVRYKFALYFILSELSNCKEERGVFSVLDAQTVSLP